MFSHNSRLRHLGDDLLCSIIPRCRRLIKRLKNFGFPHSFVAAPAAKASADNFIQLILHPTSGLIANNANVGMGLASSQRVIGTCAHFLKALEEGTSLALGGCVQAVETPLCDQSQLSSSNCS
jgi:hypothetical protein